MSAFGLQRPCPSIGDGQVLGLIAVGALALVGGLISLAASQPFAVFYPLLLLGVLASALPLGLLPTIRRRYAEIELQTMRAYDIG